LRRCCSCVRAMRGGRARRAPQGRDSVACSGRAKSSADRAARVTGSRIIRRLSPAKCQRTSTAVPDLFDMSLRSLRRDRAARTGSELFLYERAFDDCLERLTLMQRRFDRALLIGCPDPRWPHDLAGLVDHLEVRDPGKLFASNAGGETITEEHWHPPEQVYDLILAIGTLDTVNDLPLALQLVRHALRRGALLLGALSGGDTLPQLRNAMRAADATAGMAAPHVHPRIEAAALGQLLADAGFINPVVDIDRVPVSYASLDRLVKDLRAAGATNVLAARPRFTAKRARAAAARAFASAGNDGRTIETFEILHFAGWTTNKS
jgi:hypothetical protein